MTGLLRYAPHTGYRPGDRSPLFDALADPDPASQTRFAATSGMAGILDPWAIDRPAEELDRLVKALDENGLNGGCVCAVPLARLVAPLWVAGPEDGELLRHVRRSTEIAGQLRSKVLAVLLFADGDTAPTVQRRTAIDRLRQAADLAAERGIILGVEPIRGVSGAIIERFGDAVDLVQAAGHPGIKLIFDTSHVTDFGESVLDTYIQAYDDIAVLQLADMPGQVEVGAGGIDFVSLLSHAITRGYDGLVELEHQWSAPGADVQRQGLETLKAVDRQAHQLAGKF